MTGGAWRRLVDYQCRALVAVRRQLERGQGDVRRQRGVAQRTGPYQAQDKHRYPRQRRQP